jgi:outer membrane autotransporter protein
VLQGTLSIASDANLGSGDLILNNGALLVTGATTIDNNVTLTGVGLISNDAAVTLSGIISGGGDLIKAGSNVLTLSGNNIYSGTTSVLQGTLSIASDANLGSGDLILNNGALQVTGATTIDNNVNLAGAGVIGNDAAVTLSGVISGGGNLFKSGSNILTLSGLNTYSGTTSVLQGTLSIASDANLGSGDLILNNGALLVTGATTIDNNISLDGGVGLVSTGTAVTLSGIVSGPGQLVKEGAGLLTLTGTNTYTGATTVSAGTLRQGVAGAFVNNSAFTVNGGILDLNNFNLTVSEVKGLGGEIALGTAALTIEQTSDTSYAGAITGGGSVTKQGAGILALTGNNSFNGGLNLNAGVIEVGSATALGAGNVTVNGGILRALSTTLTGQSINVAGNYMQTGGALYLRMFGTGNFDQLNVNGTATLGGGLQVNLQNGFLPQIGEQFTLVNATGGVTNQFASVTSNLAGSLGFTAIYNPNDVTLGTVSTNIIVLETVQLPFNDFANTPNQHSVAANLDTFSTTGKMKDLIDYLNSLPGAALADAFDQLSPEELGALSRISRSYNVTFNSNLLSRLQELRAGVRGFSARGYAITDTKGERYDLSQNVLFAGVNSTPESVGLTVKKKDPMAASLDNPWGVFATGTGQFGDVDARDGLKGYGFTTGGLTVGADYRWNEGFTTGAFVGYAGSEADLDGVGGKVEADAAKFGFYAAWQKHGFYVNSAVGGGYNDYETSRTVLGAKAEGDTNGVEFNALAGAGYDFTPGNWRFGPSAHLEYSYMLIDGMTEHGSLAPLRISQQSVDSLATRLGWNLSYGWELPNGVVLAPQGSLSWRHEYFDGAESLQSRFASGAGGVFNTQVSGMNRDSALAGLSILVQWSPTITTVLGYEAEVASRYDSSTINGRIIIGF